MKFSGVVKKSLGRGKKLGFPTANLDTPADVEEGLYIAWCKVKDKHWPSLVFVGASETFGETEKKAEAYLLDFDGELYGQVLEIELLKKIREVMKFNTPEELVGQMKRDELIAREFFIFNQGHIRTN